MPIKNIVFQVRLDEQAARRITHAVENSEFERSQIVRMCFMYGWPELVKRFPEMAMPKKAIDFCILKKWTAKRIIRSLE